MKRKPSIKELKKRSAIWFDGAGLRITLSKKELPRCCAQCDQSPINSWWYDDKVGEWFTSFFTIEAMRDNYEFVSWI